MHATHGQTCQINLMGPCSFRSACFGRRPWAHELRSTDHVRNIDERAIARVNVTTLRREGSLLILGMPHRNLMCPGLIGCPHSERRLMNCDFCGCRIVGSSDRPNLPQGNSSHVVQLHLTG